MGEDPYVVKKTFSGGALLLTRMDGDDLPRPVNSDSVKKSIMYDVFDPIKSMKFWPGNSLCIYLTKKLMHDLNCSTI